jgi:hypothetical protein
MSWDENDLNGFVHCSNNNIGQITPESEIGNKIIDFVSNDSVHSILEIGTWNGHGSTRCIIEGLKQKNSFVFYSLEANADKSAYAKNLYKDIDNVHILNEVIYRSNNEEKTIFPELESNENYKFWHSVDVENMQDKPLFLLRPELPEIFDIVLLDGGEFTSWFEYQLLKDRCNILMLDDTLTVKCAKIALDIKEQPEKWEIVYESNERQGNLIAKRIM